MIFVATQDLEKGAELCRWAQWMCVFTDSETVTEHTRFCHTTCSTDGIARAASGAMVLSCLGLVWFESED